jgi:hypothetical protein
MATTKKIDTPTPEATPEVTPETTPETTPEVTSEEAQMKRERLEKYTES